MIDAISPIALSGSVARVGGASDVAASSGASPASSFADALTAAAGGAGQSLALAEQLSLKALTGGAQTREVVDAVMQAEQSLQAAIAIRDKIVTAYLEITRMSI